MRKRKAGQLAGLLAASSLVLGACGAGGEAASPNENGDDPITLSYAFFASENSFPGVQMTKWAEEVEERTDGKVEVELYPGGTLLDAENMYKGVRDGVVDIGLSSPTYEPGQYPLLSISDMPSGISSSLVASQVTSDLLTEFEPEAMSDVKILTTFTGDPAYVQTKQKVESMDDLSGMQIRIAGSNADVLEALNGSPVGMSLAEVPEALQTNVIEGNISSREVLYDFKLGEMVDYVVDYPLSTASFVAVMNQGVWDSLPQDVQDVIEEVNAEMPAFTGQYLDDSIEDAMSWSKEEHGLEVVTLSDDEQQRWQEQLLQLQDDAVEKANNAGLPGDEYRERFYELIEKYENQ
ncbi:TRAP transporter substrate-binding protein [Evansella clarkii]|uniref:TRAP transporter substrate-binding protein n=1 Tax=Evansella clarkii TaxID=79879 RepID=UPI0009977BFE|nr:TRAP transporter substrate-binding protein [Evansella clarkii]